MDWTTKTAIITGANTGIGQAAKLLLRSKGCTVYTLDLSLPADESERYFVPCHVRERHAVKAAVDAVSETAKRIDFLVANAGNHLFADMEETTDDEFDNVLNTNITGTFYAVRSVLPHMKAQRSGSIVLMGSDQTFVGKERSFVYGLTKGAIGQLAKSTAIDCGPFDIRVNCICSGTIDSPLLHKAVDSYVSPGAANKADVYKNLDATQS